MAIKPLNWRIMNRRNLIKNTLFSTAAIASASSMAIAQQCLTAKTPKQPEGPFYPIVDQIDKDADLIRVTGKNEIAKGQIVIVEGQLSDQNCKPVQNASVEIWQACATGKYDHPSDPNTADTDPNFQYWGKSVTDLNGNYKFRTIIPGSYPAGEGWIRPAHIHFKISALGYVELITQMYFDGETLNTKDLILQRLKKEDQKKLIVQFVSIPNASHPVGQFNIQIEKI
jgi:protocatechuate 3,4-dioxygenase, beta subunit